MESGNSPSSPEFVTETQVTQMEPQTYPLWKKVLLGFLIVCFVIIFLFLVYQNGKSIYANGL